MSDASFVGTANFRQLFAHDATFTQSLKVTAYYVILAVPVLQIAALVLALAMNLRVPGVTISAVFPSPFQPCVHGNARQREHKRKCRQPVDAVAGNQRR